MGLVESGCSFGKVLLEMGARRPLGQASIEYLGRIPGQVQILADEADLEDSESFALSWHILMKGYGSSGPDGATIDLGDACKRSTNGGKCHGWAL